MKYILEAYTWSWFWKHQDEMLLMVLLTCAAAFILIAGGALMMLKKDINELEKQTES